MSDRHAKRTARRDAGTFGELAVHALDRNDLLIPATRYYMGRRTIATCAHAQALAQHWDSLPWDVRQIIRRDLEDEFRRDTAARLRGDADPPLGDHCDRQAWEKVREAWLRADSTASE